MTGLGRDPRDRRGERARRRRAGVSLDTLMRARCRHGLCCRCCRAPARSPSAARSAPTSTARTTTSSAASATTCGRSTLVTADGEVARAHARGRPELFWATVGGMGLTGVVVRATVAAAPRRDGVLQGRHRADRDLDELMARQTRPTTRSTPYSVAWFDAVTTGAHFGRGLLTRADHATVTELPAKLRGEPLKFDAPQLLTVPDVFPPGLLNRGHGQAVQRALVPQVAHARAGAMQNITAVPPPAGHHRRWNRATARAGSCSTSSSCRLRGSEVIRTVLELMTAARGSCRRSTSSSGSARATAAPLSFPMPGWTLVRRHPHRGRAWPRCCDELDELVARRGRAALPGQGVAHHARGDPPRLPAVRRVAQGARRRRPQRRVRLRHVPTPPLRSSLSDRRRRQPAEHAAARRHLGDRPGHGRGVRVRPAAARGARRAARAPRLDGGRGPARARAGCAVEMVPFDAREPEHAADVSPRRSRRRHRRRAGRVRAARRQREGVDRRAAAVELAQVNYTAAGRRRRGAGASGCARQGHGSIVALSSVAGERARRSNFVYGSTKAGLDAFYSGLAEALRGRRRARHGRAARASCARG